MKQAISLAVLAGFAGAAIAGNFTAGNAERANAVIDAALQAHGGMALTEDLETLVVFNESVNHAVGQSRGAEPPWDTAESEGVDAVHLDERVFVTSFRGGGGGFEGDTVTIVNGESSANLDLRAGTVQPVAERDYATRSGPFVRVTPALLLRALDERRANAHYLGDVRLEGRVHDVIGFSMQAGPAITLYIDRKSGMLSRSERVVPGIGLVEYVFDDYERIDGIAVNRRFTLYLNGDLNLERKLFDVRVNEPLDELLEVDARLARIPALEPDPLSRQEIADGVWLIGGTGTYAMFVDMGDYIFAAGGTAGIPDRIASLREVAGDKPIRYGMMTHHHFDHVLGVEAYEDEGATVIASKAHEAVVRRAAENGEGLPVKTVDARMTVDSGARRIEIIDIGPTAHAEHILVAYLPAEGILFEADHFALPRSGPIPPAVSSTRSFAEALARHELRPAKVASAHSPRIGTMADLETALEARLFSASR